MRLPVRLRRLGFVVGIGALSVGGCGGRDSSPGAAESPLSTTAKVQPLKVQARVAHTNQELKTPSFVWLSSPNGKRYSIAKGATPTEVASATLRSAAPTLKLGAAAVASAHVTAVQDNGSGLVVTRFGQTVDGVDVFRATLNVAMDRDLQPLAITGSLAPSTKALDARGWQLDASAAIASAFKTMTGGSLVNSAVGTGNEASGGYQQFSFPAADGTGNPLYVNARAKRVWFPKDRGLLPAWYVELDLANSRDTNARLNSFVIQSVDGSVLFRHNMVANDTYQYRVWADQTGPKGWAPLESPYGNGMTPNATGTLDPNAMAPAFVKPSLVALQNIPFSKNDPWLPANATQLMGNNVWAYADLVAPDGYTPMSADELVTPTAPGVFDRTWDPTTLPGASQANIAAVTTNLFFIINYMHDLFYDAGWTEAMGNSQIDNYNRGGHGGDPVLAESQDFSGVDNANAATPADGAPPRIQMFLWDTVAERHVTVKAPMSIAGDLTPTALLGFGPPVWDLTNDVVLYADATGGKSQACGTPADAAHASNAAALKGKIALIDRGICPFSEKALNAQAAGALGVIIANNVPGNTVGNFNGYDPGLTMFPGMMITYEDGQKLRMAAGTVTVRLMRGKPNRDGSVDGSVVSHEWGHTMSNRLIGNGNGLTNQQGGGMGEGWSDFVWLLTYIRPTDLNVPSNANWDGVYPMGVYALGGRPSDIYYGIRRYPYSHDMSKNPLMFRHITKGEPLPTMPPPAFGETPSVPNSEPHNVGEIWASMLWDCYVGLLTDSTYTFDTAGEAMRKYLVTSLALTPISPTMIEARDALLLAASQNTAHPNDITTFAKAFARRGMGTAAIGPDRNSIDLKGVTESTEVGPDMVLSQFTFDDDVTSCDHDHVLDAGEVGTVTLTVVNPGPAPLSAPTVTLSSTNSNISFPEGASPVLPALTPFKTATVTVKVAMAAGVTTISPFDLKVTMSDPGLLSSPTAPPRVQTLYFQGNADWTASGSLTDNVEAPLSLWSIGADPNLSTDTNWTRILTPGVPYSSSWHNQGPLSTADQYLVSPSLHVGTGDFKFTFDNAFNFEEGNNPYTNMILYFDGGVVEISADNGATWTDLGDKFTANGYNISLYDGKDPNLGPTTNPLKGRKAFGSTSMDFPKLQASTVDLGTAYAGKTVRIRFRVGSDQGAGYTGWLVDNIAFSGLTDMPFPAEVADRKLCMNHVPVIKAGDDQVVNEGATVMLDGSSSTDADNGTMIQFHWTQIAGPTVGLSDATAVKPTFTAPQVDADARLTFRLLGYDGQAFGEPADVTVLVKNISTGDMGTDMGHADMGHPDMGPSDMASPDMASPPHADMGKPGDKGGCSVSGNGAPASALPLLGLALLALALRRRFV